MKKLLMICLCLVCAAFACKKEEQKKDIIEKPQLPPDPAETAPVGGILQPDVPGLPIVRRTLNMPLAYNKHISLDVDADGVTDFGFFSQLIAHSGKSYLYLMITPKTIKGSSVMVQNGEEEVVNALWSVPLDISTEIKDVPAEGRAWTSHLMKAFVMSISETGSVKEYNGLWIDKKSKYLGIKFKIAGKFHYGWVKLSHTKLTDEVIFEDYAYSKVPEQGIIAGKTE